MQYPFSPEILDALPEAAARHFRALETELLQMICQQLKTGQMNEVSVQAIRTLRSHGIPLKDIEAAIQRHTALSRSELNSLLNDVVQRNQAYYTSAIDMAGLTAPDTLAGAADIAAISMQTAAELENITQSIGFVSRAGRDIKLSEAYTWALDQAALKVQSGAASYNAAIADAVKQLADSGIRYIDYESGHRDRADVAVRRAVMTGIVQLNAKYAEQSVDYLETDLVEVTAHMGARNTGGMPENHELWQGRVYRWAAKTRPDAPQSSGEYPDFIRCTGYGDVQGLEGANCRHHYFPFVEGVSERTYTDEQLEQMKAKKFEYEGKEYDTYTASQKQRQIERTVRKLTRERDAYKAAGLTDDATAVNVKLRRLKQKYTEFSKAAGLPEQRERMKVRFTDDVSEQRAAKLKTQRDAEAPIREAIKNGTYPLSINPEKQARHLPQSARPGASIVTIPLDELQKIINANAGNGKILLLKDTYKWKNQEIIYAGKEIGFTTNNKGDTIIAKSLKIHYSKTGVHAVPYSRWWKK